MRRGEGGGRKEGRESDGMGMRGEGGRERESDGRGTRGEGGRGRGGKEGGREEGRGW